MQKQFPHHCSVSGCTATFSSNSTLRRHIRIVHNGTKNAECAICHKSFRDNYSLRVHAKVHSDPAFDAASCLDCPVCKKTFGLRAAYSNHIKVHKRTWPQELPPPTSDEVSTVVIKDETEPPSVPTVQSCAEVEQSPSVLCFICDREMECRVFLGHVQEHVKALIQVCTETAETLVKCEVSLERADAAINSS